MAGTLKEDSRRELLSVLPKSECCINAFLSAVSKVAGTLEGIGKRRMLCVSLDTPESAEEVAKLFKTLYPTEFLVSEHQMKIAGADRRMYKVTVPHGFTTCALEDFELMRTNDEGFMDFVRGTPQQLLRKECCMRAYLKGLYLAGGSVYAPEPSEGKEKKQGYHFELRLSDEEFASSVMELMSDLRINTKMSDRNGVKLLYVKDKDEIVRIICLLELSDCASKMQSIIDERETANLLNRTVICETANMDKTFAASSRLMIAIARLKDHDMYDSLPANLKATADARARYSEASMQELADILNIGKSCLHHRLKKIETLADELI